MKLLNFERINDRMFELLHLEQQAQAVGGTTVPFTRAPTHRNGVADFQIDASGDPVSQ